MEIGEAVEWLKSINIRKTSVSDILQGCTDAYLGDWLGRGSEMDAIIKYRVSQCAECPLYKHGGCDPTNTIPHVSTGMLVAGCGCSIKCKSALKSAECPAGKWLSVP